MRRAAALVCLAGVLLIAAAGSAAAKPLSSQAAPQAPLGQAGRWITDRSGRVVILHGLNMVNKRPPYQPGAVGFGADDAAFLRRNGFNTIRLGLIYKAVEPQPGRYATGYLRTERSIERTLARRGVFSLVDFHQDLYNEKFGGEGWPDWAVLDDGQPAEPLTGFPGSYITSPGLNRSFDNWWANNPGPGSVPLQVRYARAWAKVAGVFRPRCDRLFRRAAGPRQHLHDQQQRQRRPGGDDAGAQGGMGGADVRGDGGDDPGGERDSGDRSDFPAGASVVDHGGGGDDEHAVDTERKGVGHLGAFAVAQRDVDHMRI